MGRTLLAGTPRDPQPGGEAVEAGSGLWLTDAVQPAPIHPFAELGLGRADFSD
jgi:hypothetical protein